jgi:hypothetical protein
VAHSFRSRHPTGTDASPDRFGALFCTMPVIDMRRYHKLLIGPAMTDEYGDPDKPEDRAFLAAISAYHVATPDQAYPPILIATSRSKQPASPHGALGADLAVWDGRPKRRSDGVSALRKRLDPAAEARL